MNYKLTSLILSFIVFTFYVTYITIKFGWLRSVSASYFYLKDKWLFTIALFAFSMLLAMAGNTMLTVLAAAAICFSGAASNTKDLEMTETVHNICSTAGIVLGMAALIIDFGLWYFVLPQLIFTVLAMKRNMKNHTFWIEIVAYYLVWIGVGKSVISSFAGSG
jgi:hypothetical protein